MHCTYVSGLLGEYNMYVHNFIVFVFIYVKIDDEGRN